MHLLDQRTLGVAIVFLLGLLVIVKRAATGSILEKPQGGPLLQLVNVFNLFFLLVLNPLVAVLLIARRFPSIEPTHVSLGSPWLDSTAEIAGLILYGGGCLLMAWALVTLGRRYQLGGSVPRPEDRMVVSGVYRMIRHPMYTAALSISLGLALLIQSAALVCLFVVYLVLILRLIPVEEEGLRRAYGEQYADYQARTGVLIPFLR